VEVQVHTDLAFSPAGDDAVQFTNDLGGVTFAAAAQLSASPTLGIVIGD
jgi:hypothetical protein